MIIVLLQDRHPCPELSYKDVAVQDWEAKDACQSSLRRFLQRLPDNDGIFESSSVQLKKGQSVIESYYTPLREGKVAVKAIAGGLQNPEITIEFRYTPYVFWFIALIGGLFGGIAKKVLEKNRLTPDEYRQLSAWR